MTGKQILLGGGIVGGILLIFLGYRKRGDIMTALKSLATTAGRAVFAQLIDTRARPYADAFIDAGQTYGFSPFVVYKLIEHESGFFGLYLLPQYAPAGVGDRVSRWVTQSDLDGRYAFAKEQKLLTGRTLAPGAPFPPETWQGKRGLKNGVSVRFEVNPPRAGGAAVAGWGYGWAQVDYATGDRAFIASGDWKEPRKAIFRAARLLDEKRKVIRARMPKLDERTLLQAAVAAYNTGEGNVLASLAAGRPIDATTASGRYSKDILDRATSVAADFTAKVPTPTAGLGGVGGSGPTIEGVPVTIPTFGPRRRS